ncbi:MAG: hypothetical protein K2L12_00500 [Clostridia bacterium]|nr:hypothetical protein [Clostridia bacterium]
MTFNKKLTKLFVLLITVLLLSFCIVSMAGCSVDDFMGYYTNEEEKGYIIVNKDGTVYLDNVWFSKPGATGDLSGDYALVGYGTYTYSKKESATHKGSYEVYVTYNGGFYVPTAYLYKDNSPRKIMYERVVGKDAKGNPIIREINYYQGYPSWLPPEQ